MEKGYSGSKFFDLRIEDGVVMSEERSETCLTQPGKSIALWRGCCRDGGSLVQIEGKR